MRRCRSRLSNPMRLVLPQQLCCRASQFFYGRQLMTGLVWDVAAAAEEPQKGAECGMWMLFAVPAASCSSTVCSTEYGSAMHVRTT